MSKKICNVFMKKDLEKVGAAGQLIKVSKGYADSYLVPQGYAVLVNDNEIAAYEKRNIKSQEKRLELESKSSFLAEKIKSTTIEIKEKTHDGSKLYGAIKSQQVVEALKDKGIIVSKSQIEFKDSIKATGEYPVVVALSSKIKAELKLKIASV